MNRVAGIGLILFLAILLGGQTTHPDHTTDQFIQSVSDSAYQFELNGQLEKAESYYRKAIALAREQQFLGQEGKNTRYLGLLYQSQGRNDSALLCYRRALPILQAAGDSLQLGKLTADLGNRLNYLGDFQGAIEEYLEASKVFASLGLDSINTIIFGNIGYAFIELNDFAQAERYNRKALDIARRHQMLASTGVAYMNLGSSLKGLGQHDSVRWYFEQALAMGRLSGNQSLQIRATANLAGLEADQGHYAEAVRIIEPTLAIAPTPADKLAQEALMGRYLTQTGALARARTYLSHSLEMAQKIGLKEDEREALLNLAKLEQKLGRTQAANQYLQAYISLSDTLQSATINEQSQRLTILYETERKDKENQELKAENAEKAFELQVSKAKSLRNLLLFLLFASLFLGTVGFFVFYRKNAENKRRIAEQKADMNRRQLEQLKQKQQIKMMKAMLEGQETERSRLARDLHDGLGGLLASVRMQFDQVRQGVPSLKKHHDFDHATILLQKAGSELRQIAHDLMPANLRKFGLVPALEDFISEVNYSNQVRIDLQCYGLDQRLPEIYEISLYRVVQELIHNLLKHASATEALVQIMREGDSLHLTVEDNGVGMDPQQWQKAQGHGLRNIQSRIEYLEGTAELHSHPASGTSIMIEIKLKDYDTAPDSG